MIKLYHSPRSRSVRVRWLLEKLGLPYELVQRAYKPPALPFAQDSPMGKFPALEDGPVVMIESGAIVEYLLEQYGAGRTLDVLAGELGDKRYLLGDEFTAADIMMAYGLQWAQQFGLLETRPKLAAYLQRLLARPAALRAAEVSADW